MYPYHLFIWLLLTLDLFQANDDCENALVVTSFPYQVDGDTTLATVDFPTPTDKFRNLTCGITTEGRGIWYRIQGNDQFLQATVTDITSAKFNTALFKGSSCDDDGLECLLNRQYEIANQRTQPASTWFAKKGEFYYLHVTGVSEEDVGIFSLDIQDVPLDRPTNDHCETAKTLSVDSLITGDSTGAWPHELENPNCSLHAFSRGLFYSLEGTGETMAITLTTDIPEDRTLEVAILTSEECNECVMYSDFLTAEDTPHTLELATDKNKNYTVVVSGEGYADVGVFQLEMDLKITSGGVLARKTGGILLSLWCSTILLLATI